MRLADWPRAQNRAKLNDLYNGFPPFSDDELGEGRFATNVNFLSGTTMLHNARLQFNTAFNSTPQLFTVTIDRGPAWKRRVWSEIVTKEMNKRIKNSREFLGCRKSVFALDVLHGIGPSYWENRQAWCPKSLGVEDVLVPSDTLTDTSNLPFFAIYRRYTPFELHKLTHGPKVDAAWNMDLVERAIAWADKEAQNLMSTTWPEVWSPEKMSERIKQDSGLYASDCVPTIDTFDVYFWDDSDDQAGWKRRIVLDAWGTPGYGGIGFQAKPNIKAPGKYDAPDRTFMGSRNEFLYDSGDRVFADKIDQIIHFQFADCSCVAPFRYHSVRSMGWLNYSVCKLENMLRCKLSDATFEAMLQYFRVDSPADQQRAEKVELRDRGVIPPGVHFIQPNERWQVPQGLVEFALQLNRQTLAENSVSYSSNVEANDESDETATKTNARVDAGSALIGSVMTDAYNQAEFQYREIGRRFCNKSSSNADVRAFRLACLKQGVPEEILDAECHQITANRVIGMGNKTRQQTMASRLMALRPSLPPPAQKIVDRLYILANSDDPNLPDLMVPEMQEVSDTTHDAQLTAGALLQGLPVAAKPGINYVEMITGLLQAMQTVVTRIQKTDNVGTQNEIIGLSNLGNNIAAYIKLLAADKHEKQHAKIFSDGLGKLMNEVKGFAQRFTEKQKQSGAQLDPETQAKIQAIVLTAQTKAKVASEAHAQRTAQRQLAFEQKTKQDAVQHRVDIAKTDLEAAANVKRNGRLKAF